MTINNDFKILGVQLKKITWLKIQLKSFLV